MNSEYQTPPSRLSLIVCSGAIIQMVVLILAEIVISLNKNTMFDNLVNPDSLHKYFVGMCSDV